MKISVRVKPKARLARVVKTGEGFVVSVKAVAEGGKANEEVVETLADHFSVPKSAVKIVTGFTARNKIVDFGQGVKF